MSVEQSRQFDVSILGWQGQTRSEFAVVTDMTLGGARDYIVPTEVDPAIGAETRLLAQMGGSLILDARRGRDSLAATSFGGKDIWNSAEEVAEAGFGSVIQTLVPTMEEIVWANSMRDGLGLPTIIDASRQTLEIPTTRREIDMLGSAIADCAVQSDPRQIGNVILPNGSDPEATRLRNIVLGRLGPQAVVWVYNEVGVPSTRRVADATSGQSVRTMLLPHPEIRGGSNIVQLKQWAEREPARVIQELDDIPQIILPAKMPEPTPQKPDIAETPLDDDGWRWDDVRHGDLLAELGYSLDQ